MWSEDWRVMLNSTQDQIKLKLKFELSLAINDGAEVCDLVGLFLLSELKKLNKNVELGCYKDDGLAVSKLTSKQTETLKKKMRATFRKFGLEITIEANKKTVQFLNVEFHLETSQYRPFLKTWRYTPLCKCI